MDTESYDVSEETQVLLKLLAFGADEIKQGRFRPAEHVLRDLDQSDE
ncbi:hypothetical protein [Burkholderia stabilis]|nr:hypothetical protein [Burkholderia stabilis]HDR9492677.1 hypothetical protein [Burkholderia stabilis]HDR9525813.1 hypothetical protein [Burkholderia stabilis]HDR9532137.1 hypothetical protein [Burkholderia stabilis]HDR9539988.1 hypothetical protein [Burkholderia stabilis]HDR9548406.1 hypothetical protein [Burkholderia stabilis]